MGPTCSHNAWISCWQSAVATPHVQCLYWWAGGWTWSFGWLKTAEGVLSWSYNGCHGHALSCIKKTEHRKLSQKVSAHYRENDSLSHQPQKTCMSHLSLTFRRALELYAASEEHSFSLWRSNKEIKHLLLVLDFLTHRKWQELQVKSSQENFAATLMETGQQTTYPQSPNLCEPATVSDANVVCGGGTDVTCCQVGTSICWARLDQACHRSSREEQWLHFPWVVMVTAITFYLYL